MKFYYPNFQNDMWRIFGILFFGDKEHFVDAEQKTFRLNQLIPFLEERGIALFDTCTHIRRTTGTASDKDLEIVAETDLLRMLGSLPHCQAVVTAGQLATEIAARQFGVTPPKVGTYATFTLGDRSLRLYRMPSSSRAYPMRAERKADFYRQVFCDVGMLSA